ncbi:undecaprenyl-phosphate glucose phosphotransferase [Flavobacterium sp. DG1-102-2]|uniref:undecaprenyl-phosphate glucose phosphotransferase n=1 Tax=Flavobacterium sp. DG1-102-2 TaxID=3081663 RepID=UPI0029499D38|nr:undecaprenyl-phosphate glucose phosphotransferase [Flavobacterium sp. DG1-102-2]MDV6167723.1 undecaprenyl-phosphate glucose phosphotransferase [Flavobacterium sp. DG1-102-2]
MILSGRGRYSKYLRPVTILFDLVVISILPHYFFKELGVQYVHYTMYQIACWSVISYFSGFYEVYRYTEPITILSKIVKQGTIFLLSVIAFFPFAKHTVFSGQRIAEFLVTAFVFIIMFKFLTFYALKKHRIVSGSNLRRVIIIGCSPQALRLKALFETRVDYGYHFMGFFSDKKTNIDVKGKTADIAAYATLHNIDDIYCSLSDISNTHLKDLIAYAEANNKTIKFIPDSNEIFSKNLRIDYYEFFPLLSLQKSPFDEPIAKLVKRVFDIVFSFLVIVLLLSWLTPIIALFIRIESKGPIFFKQSRAGINGDHFSCFKFRSMQVNNNTDQLAVKNDPRVTKVGRFLRKTSLDEMPQFMNVFLGDMSVVGPRPHIGPINTKYGDRIKKYVLRHRVKPGITGLAQVRGARGEINADEDMINRIKYDVFYIDNWSILLDIKIIIQTVVNIFMGDEKAY